MHKVSRTLLLAGVMAFGTLTAACGDKVQVTQATPDNAVQSVTVSPQNASIAVGGTITLASNVTSTGTAAKTVAWTTSSATIATVDATTGKVTGVSAGTVTITATATADASKAAAAAIIVTPTAPVPLPSIAIASVLQGTAPVVLGNASGQLDIAVNNSGGGLIDVYLSSSCTTNTIAASDTPAATQQTTSAQPGTVVLSVNTAAVTASNAPKYPNGNYCIKARLTSGTVVVVATNTTPITLNNANQFKGTVSFTSVTGGPTSAVSSLTGLNYNQGSMTITLNPVVFTSSSPIALISGFVTRNGSVAAGVPSALPATFTNVAVASGAATVFLTDTIGSAIPVAGNRSIAQYFSAQGGDTVYVTSASDAAGNPITVAGGQFAVVGGIRIDNQPPAVPAGSNWTVVAPNGYIGAAYAFTSGTVAPSVDTAATLTPTAGIKGVGGVTTKYYVGTAGSTVFATPGSCNITGLTLATVGTDLANTISTTADQAKVVVSDALGNQVCANVISTQLPATIATFGVDKIAPVLADSVNAAIFIAATGKGYAASRTWTFAPFDTISGFNGTPLRGTIVRNFFTNTGTPPNDCVLGTYSATALTCTATAGGFANSTEFTNSTGVVGYYTISAYSQDQAGNKSATISKTAAFDNTAPTIGALTQAAPVAPLGAVTVSGPATEDLDLNTFSGHLLNANAPNPFASVTGSFGTTFDATLVQAASASVSLPNVYRGLQTTIASGAVQANATPNTATITVTNVAGTAATSAVAIPIVTTTNSGAVNNILTGAAFATIPVRDSLASSVNGVQTTAKSSAVLTLRVIGSSVDAAFQSQPFTQVDIYKVVGGELTLVGNNTLAGVADDFTIGTGQRTYSFTQSVTLVTTAAAGAQVFYAIGRNAAGDAVISNSITITNP